MNPGTTISSGLLKDERLCDSCGRILVPSFSMPGKHVHQNTGSYYCDNKNDPNRIATPKADQSSSTKLQQ